MLCHVISYPVIIMASGLQLSRRLRVQESSSRPIRVVLSVELDSPSLELLLDCLYKIGNQSIPTTATAGKRPRFLNENPCGHHFEGQSLQGLVRKLGEVGNFTSRALVSIVLTVGFEMESVVSLLVEPGCP